MADFQTAFKKLILIEGGYSDNPLDSGGKTKYGITEKVARQNGYMGEMKDFTFYMAQEIYFSEYWSIMRLNEIQSQDIANKIFDIGVNCGIMVSGRFLQQTLNVLNRRQRDWKDVQVDGIIGDDTLEKLNKAIITGREKNILKVLNILQGNHYINIATHSEKNEEFVNGWLRRINIEERI